MSTSFVYIFTLFDFLVLFLSHSVAVLCKSVSHFRVLLLDNFGFVSPTNFEGNSRHPANETRDSREEIAVSLLFWKIYRD